MKPTPPTSTDLTFREMLEEVMDLAVGLGVGLLPLLLLAVPGIILFVVLILITIIGWVNPRKVDSSLLRLCRKNRSTP